MNIKDEIQLIFAENGIDILDKNQLIEIDSLQYVTIIVEIEQKYNIIFPDSYLEKNMAEDFDEFIKLIVMLIEGALSGTEVMLSEDTADM